MTAGKQLGREISNTFCKNAQKGTKSIIVFIRTLGELTFAQRRLGIKATFK